MESAPFELHLFVSLAVILGAALVALIVDYLKGNNEHLRERNIELRVRQEELEKRGPADPWQWFQQRMQPTRLQHRTASWLNGAATEAAERQAPSTAMHAARGMSETRQEETATAQPAEALMSPRRARAEQQSEEVRTEVWLREQWVSGQPGPFREESQEVQTQVRSQASPLLEQVIAVTPSRLGAAPEPLSAESVVLPDPVTEVPPDPVFPVAKVEEPQGDSLSLLRPLIEAQAGTSVISRPLLEPDASPFSFHTVDRKPERPAREASEPRLVETREAGEAPVAPAAPQLPAQVADEPEIRHAPELGLPAGFHERSAAVRLIEQGTPVTGLVVAIGILDFDRIRENAGRAGLEELMRSVTSLIRSLPGEGDFGARTAEDEFILAYRIADAAAQQRITNRIAERLWDFQLRSLGGLSVMFRWGALEVRALPLGESIGEACERMRQTRRSRKTISMDSAAARRRASA